MNEDEVNAELENPVTCAGVAIMDSIDPELYRRLGELFGQTPTPQD